MKSDFSREHIIYVGKLKSNRRLVLLSRILVAIALFGLWELAADLKLIDSFIFSSPSRMAKTLVTLFAGGEIFKHIGITLYETIMGFVLATLSGTAVALALWWFPTLKKVAEPYIVVLNSLPKIALGPMIIIWFGAGTGAIVFMTFLVTVIITVITMLNGFNATDKDMLLLMRTMGANRLQTLTKLVLPSSVPVFISMLKINIGLAWIGSIMGEYLVSKSGLGYLIVYGGHVFKLDLVMASTLVLCLLAGGMYALVALIEKKSLRR